VGERLDEKMLRWKVAVEEENKKRFGEFGGCIDVNEERTMFSNVFTYLLYCPLQQGASIRSRASHLFHAMQ